MDIIVSSSNQDYLVIPNKTGNDLLHFIDNLKGKCDATLVDIREILIVQNRGSQSEAANQYLKHVIGRQGSSPVFGFLNLVF